MSVDYMLFRITPSQPLEMMSELLPFGSQKEIVDRLCDVLGFERDLWEDEHVQPEIEAYLQSQGWSQPDYERPLRATMIYRYHHEHDAGRVVSYALQDDPVVSFSTNRAYPEDFLSVIDVLQDLSPFTIMGPHGPIDPESLFYTFDDWIQKNYEEAYPLNYEG